MTLRAELEKIFSKEQIRMRPIDRIAYASDYSFYRMIPQAVVRPKNIADIQSLLNIVRAKETSVTFRASGTSMSGQAVTEGILVDLMRNFSGMQVLDNGERVRTQPGVIAGRINQSLAPYGRRIGPDPSSINAASIGGILANNSGGKSVALKDNAYHTLESMTLVLPNGFVLNTRDEDAETRFRGHCPEIAEGLMQLKQRIESDPALCKSIRKKTAMRNTVGYSLNAFLDFQLAHEILAHLLIGSEGTLGFISEAVLKTVPIPPLLYNGLLFFKDLMSAGEASAALIDTGPSEMEFIDRNSIRNVQDVQGCPEFLKSLPESTFAVFLEYQCGDREELLEIQKKVEKVCESLDLIEGSAFSDEPDQRATLKNVRTAVVRETFSRHPQGSIAQIEDVIVPVPRVAEAIADLKSLFKRYPGYENMVVFGHWPFGNIHYIISPAFDSAENISIYDRFMNAVADLIIGKYNGCLRGEHATGRNLAPFVKKEWGQTAYDVMKALKQLIDPDNIMNPGVILNDDEKVNIKNLKTIPKVYPEIDQCLECGHCEWVCPSRDLTLTPRQRIVVQREIARLEHSGKNPDILADLLKNYSYDGIETCAADGMCAVACPIDINTADLTRRLRTASGSRFGQKLALQASRHFAILEKTTRQAVRWGHDAQRIFGPKWIDMSIRFAEALFRTRFPKWTASMPMPPARKLPSTSPENAQVVYFPSCINRIMGSSSIAGKGSIVETFLTVSQRAGISVWLPNDVFGYCCGTPFSSKGYETAFADMFSRTIEKLWEWSHAGALPVFMDASSCVYTLRSGEPKLAPEIYEKWRRLTILDPIEYIHDHVLPGLNIRKLNRSVAIHPACGMVKLGLKAKMETVARQCATSVTIPLYHGCCGFAGDRGMLFPELTRSATRAESAELNNRDYDGYYGSNLTCEIGMSDATGRLYESIVYLLEDASA